MPYPKKRGRCFGGGEASAALINDDEKLAACCEGVAPGADVGINYSIVLSTYWIAGLSSVDYVRIT
jgi:hypothetical protein